MLLKWNGRHLILYSKSRGMNNSLSSINSYLELPPQIIYILSCCFRCVVLETLARILWLIHVKMYLDMLKSVIKSDEFVSGYVRSFEDAFEVLRCYELEDQTHFVCTKRPGTFGKKGLSIGRISPPTIIVIWYKQTPQEVWVRVRVSPDSGVFSISQKGAPNSRNVAFHCIG